MTSDPIAVPVPPPPRSLLASRLAWPVAAVVYAAAMCACALWGLKVGERGIDSRSLALAAVYAAGCPLGLLALAPIYHLLMPRRVAALRFLAALLLVAGASVAAIAFVAFAVNSPWWHALQPGVPMLIRLRMLAESYALNVFLFLTIGYRVAMPQGLVPLVLAALWLADRRRRV